MLVSMNYAPSIIEIIIVSGTKDTSDTWGLECKKNFKLKC